MDAVDLAMRFPGIPWWWPMMADAADTAARQFSAEELGKWIAILMFLAGGGLGIKKLLQKRESPQTTQEVSPPATKDEVNELKKDLTARLDQLDQELEKMRTVARDSQGKVHARIDKVAENLAEMKGKLDQANTSLNLLLERSLKPGSR